MLALVFTSCDTEETTYDPLNFPEQAFVALENATPLSIAENSSGSVDIVVNYSNSTAGATSDVNVTYQISSSAVEGVDYTVSGSSTQLSFPVGTFTRKITITPINNLVEDGNKVLNITLTGSDGAPIGYPGPDGNNTSVTLTIVDDDCAFTFDEFDGVTWSGEDNAPAGQGPNPTQITTAYDGTTLYMEGISYGWLTGAYWDEVIVTSTPVVTVMDPVTGVFTIALQPLCTTTWLGNPQPAYSISANGQYFPCLREMVVNYSLYQSGAVLRQYTETITF